MNVFKRNGTVIIFILGILVGVAITTLARQNAMPESVGDGTSAQDSVSADDDGTVHVTHIIDGDTMIISGGEHVRLIGIDTPERGEPYYREATQQLRELIEGKNIRMEKDVSERDRYGRLLRHIYVGDLWVNAEMIRAGYARFVTFPPDVKHVRIFERLEREARENQRGLWGL